MRRADGTVLTREEELAVKARLSKAFDEVFCKWEPVQKVRYPLLRAWWVEAEEYPVDLAELITEFRSLWQLCIVGADGRLAQYDKVGELIRACSARRREPDR
jgi:hypothetical protein